MKNNSPRYSRAMPIRQASAPIPYLFTDERVAQTVLLRAVRRLPRGGAVIFRHYQTPEQERLALYRRVRMIARRRGVRIVISGGCDRRYGTADGRHVKGHHGYRHRAACCALRPMSMGVHNWRELAMAARSGVAYIFISPVFDTNSHKGVRPLGPIAYHRMAQKARRLGIIPLPLGGMNAARARMMKATGFGAIDGLV